MNEVDNNVESCPVLSVKDWLITFLILIIPIVNIVMMFVWAFNDPNKTKSNYFKAALIMSAISIVLWLLFAGSIFALITSAMGYGY
ncbi:MAG: hypothetical protein ACOWWH_04990 [Eubacteriaceae bacterium]